MGEPHALLQPQTETKSTIHGPPSRQDPPFISSRSVARLLRALERTQTALEQQHKARFQTYITYQKQKQPYLALQYANECAQFRKLTQTIQSQQFRLSRLYDDLQSATTEEERVKLRICILLIIQTLEDYVATASLAMRQHMAPLVEMLDYNLRPYY